MTGFEPVYLGNRPKVLGHYTTFPENEQLRMMLSTGFPAKGLRGWEHSGTIRGPFPCRRNALPLSYAPNRSSHAPYLVSYNCLLVSSRKLTKLLELSAQVVLGTRLKWRDSNSHSRITSSCHLHGGCNHELGGCYLFTTPSVLAESTPPYTNSGTLRF